MLALLDDHGAALLHRGRRAAGEDESLPLEGHLIRFPSQKALDGHLADRRGKELMERCGEVFDIGHAVRVDTLAGSET